ncbi:hypothetical protein [Pediococcus pentosaceus]|uniref:hypothetical protein n=1 Tax=Pediococcus pentosaceus TaxID=1255 RepID=UPI004034FF72
MTKDISEEFLNLVKALDSDTHTIFIHVDRKSGDFNEDIVKNNLHHSAAIFVPRVDVTWGDSPLLEVSFR